MVYGLGLRVWLAALEKSWSPTTWKTTNGHPPMGTQKRAPVDESNSIENDYFKHISIASVSIAVSGACSEEPHLQKSLRAMGTGDYAEGLTTPIQEWKSHMLAGQASGAASAVGSNVVCAYCQILSAGRRQ